MALAETARLIASLELKDQFSATAAKIDRNLTGLEKSMSRSERAGRQVGTGIRNGVTIAAGAIGFLATQIGFGLNQLSKLEDATAQTNAVLKSTRSVAGQTAQSIRDLAEKYEGLNATIDDKVIQSGENLLLTFTNIRSNAFEPALRAALDMNQALGGGEAGLQGTIQKLGKALNDPIKGLTALGRVGITFTKSQKDQIKAAVDANDTFKAQSIILAELTKRFGGSFAAAGNTAKGTMAGIGDAVEDLQKALATGLFPVVQKVLPKIRAALADPAVIRGIQDFGNSIAGLFSDKNLAAGADFLKGAFQTAKEAAPVVAEAAKQTFSLVQGAVGLFKSLPPEIQKLAVGAFAINKLTGGLVTNIAGGIVGAILGQLKSAVVNVQGAVVNVGGAAGVGGVAGAAGAGGTGLLGKIAKGALGVTILGIVAEAAVPIGKAFADFLPKELKGPGGLGKTDSQLAFEHEHGPATVSPATQKAVAAAVAAALRLTSVGVGAGLTPGKAAAEAQAQQLGHLAESMRLGVNVWANGFRAMVDAIKNAKTAQEIRAAIKTAIQTVITQGRGNVQSTIKTIAALKEQLKNTHDPKLRAELSSAIRKVEAKLPARQFAAQSFSALQGMLRDGKLSKSELTRIKGIEQALKDRGLPHAAEVISQKVKEAQRAQVAASKAAGQQAAFAIRDKDLSVVLQQTINPAPIHISVSALYQSTRTYAAYGNRYTNEIRRIG